MGRVLLNLEPSSSRIYERVRLVFGGPTRAGESPGVSWLGYMAFYARYVLPRIVDLAMRNKESARLRAAWIPHARGCLLLILFAAAHDAGFVVWKPSELKKYEQTLRSKPGANPYVRLKDINGHRAVVVHRLMTGPAEYHEKYGPHLCHLG